MALLGANASQAAAHATISTIGSAAGQTHDPQGLAVDEETGALYVADRLNNRVDVFGSDGSFDFAFGWGVRSGAAELQTCTTATGCRAGLPGAGNGQMEGPISLAVDNDPTSASFHDVYVADAQNLRIEKFSPAGEFLLKFGRAGSGDGEFGEAETMQVAVGPTGTVYVIDARRLGSSGEFTSKVDLFEPTGVYSGAFALSPTQRGFVNALAADPTGSVYVATGASDGVGGFVEGSIGKYGAGGELLESIPGGNVYALGMGADGDLYVATVEALGSDPLSPSEGAVREYNPSGAPIRAFAYEAFSAPGASGVTAALEPFHSPSGDLYLALPAGGEETGSRVEHLDFPPPGPVVYPNQCQAGEVKGSKATMEAAVNPEGTATTYHFQYLTQAQFEAGGFGNPAVKSTPESAAIGPDVKLHGVKAEVSGLAPETEYRCRVVATDGTNTREGEDGSFETLENFRIEGTWAVQVGTDFAALSAEINPLEVGVSGQFEYVDADSFQASGFAMASLAPSTPIDFGAGTAPVTRGIRVEGLAPNTVYHYRISAENPFLSKPGPTRVFKTYASPGASRLPDSRAYELVSPPQKNSGDVAIPGGAGGLVNKSVRPEQAASSGDAVTYASFTAFGEDPKSAPGGSQYLSRRGPEGWTTQNITPPYNSSFTRDPLRGFSADLENAAVIQREPVLIPGAPLGVENLYLRDPAGGLTLVSSIEPEFAPTTKYCINFMGATADFGHVIFAANGRLTPEAPIAVNGQNLYEYSSAEGIRPVSLLPDESPAPPNSSLGFGAGAQDCNLGGQILKNAISADGSRSFWTTFSGTSRHLYARVNGAETIPLDALQGGPGPTGGGQYWAASSDGSKVFFTDENELVADAAPGDLYRYDFDAPAGSHLTDLTAGASPAAVQGVLGASEDGSSIYFAAQAKLSGEKANSEGDKAVAGRNNLYRWHEGEGFEFIATVGGGVIGDNLDWAPAPEQQTARVTPDGEHLAFLSTEQLTGFDNTDQSNGKPDSELFTYDAESGKLRCASCDPSGARPLGPTSVPTWRTPYQQVRYLSDDGTRTFFTTADPLVLADTNGQPDVYEFEVAGSGGCSPAAPGYDEASGGCINLLTSGIATAPSYLVDASADGRDVFLSTAQKLLPRDRDERYDVYDARVDGGFPEPSPTASPCEGEACRPPVPAPTETTPGSAALHSAGNTVPAGTKPCPKDRHRVKKKGRSSCVKTKKKSAKHDRRASR